MKINEIINYLTNIGVWKSVVSFEPITLGASGAKLFTVDDGIKKYVLKVTHKSFHCDEKHFKSYQKEYDFYQLNQTLQLPYIPKIIYSETHSEYGILLVMEHYQAIAHEQWNLDLQKRAVDLCAKLNSIPLEQVASLGLSWTPIQIEEDFTRNAYQNWINVINEHEGRFDCNILDILYKNLGEVCRVLNTEPQHISHGDFHPENILTDGEQLYICDWQGIHIGKGAGDISFFMSRGMGLGIHMDADILLPYYCERLSEYTGKHISLETIQKESNATTLLVSFSFWAEYLKNVPYERVAQHFYEMVDAAKVLGIL